MGLKLLKIGQINRLTVFETCSTGHYLRAQNSDLEILLPQALGPKHLALGQKVEAFTYYDSDQVLMATTEVPNALVGEFALMTVVETKQFGAFFDWGIKKDLLVPDTELRLRVHLDEEHIIRICVDENTNKIYGTTKINPYIQASEFDIEPEQKVTVVPAIEEELGYRCIINKKYIGMIYYNEIFQDIYIGEPIEGVVKKLREDGLVDVALQVQGFKNLVNAKEKILAYLKESGGKSTLHDKSSPQEISDILNMSKKTFKSTIGMLYKEQKILINKDGIELIG
jgi:predicted RNA-binding protein (virulence factor B family)